MTKAKGGLCRSQVVTPQHTLMDLVEVMEAAVGLASYHHGETELLLAPILVTGGISTEMLMLLWTWGREGWPVFPTVEDQAVLLSSSKLRVLQ